MCEHGRDCILCWPRFDWLAGQYPLVPAEVVITANRELRERVDELRGELDELRAEVGSHDTRPIWEPVSEIAL